MPLSMSRFIYLNLSSSYYSCASKYRILFKDHKLHLNIQLKIMSKSAHKVNYLVAKYKSLAVYKIKQIVNKFSFALNYFTLW